METPTVLLKEMSDILMMSGTIRPAQEPPEYLELSEACGEDEDDLQRTEELAGMFEYFGPTEENDYWFSLLSREFLKSTLPIYLNRINSLTGMKTGYQSLKKK